MFFTLNPTLSVLFKSIERLIKEYENTRWFWQSNHSDINKLKKILSSNQARSDKIWSLFETLRYYRDNDQDQAANEVIVKIMRAFPDYSRFTELPGIYHLKDQLANILALPSTPRNAVIDALETLEKLNLLSDASIRAFTLTCSNITTDILKIFTDKVDQKLFLQLITLHTFGCYLFEEELYTLAAHPQREALFDVLTLLHAHQALPRDRNIFSNIIAHDKTGEQVDITVIIKTLKEYDMVMKPILDFCSMTPINKRDILLYALHSMRERTTTSSNTYYDNVAKILTTLLNLDIFTGENIDRALVYAKQDKLANALQHLSELTIHLKTTYSPSFLTQPQSYFDAIVAHPYPEEIAYCLCMWRNYRTREGLDNCLAITNPHVIRLVTQFIDAAVLNPRILDSLAQLDRIYSEKDLRDIVDSFSSINSSMLPKEIWPDQGQRLIQLCTLARENPSKGKDSLLAFTESIWQKDRLERQQYRDMLLFGNRRARQPATMPTSVPTGDASGFSFGKPASGN